MRTSLQLFFVFFVPYRYRPAYKAFRSDSSFNFMIFFLIFFFQFLMLVYQSIGFRGSGYCGFLTAISQYDHTFGGILLGMLATAVAISFAVCAAGNFFLLTQVNTIAFVFDSYFNYCLMQWPIRSQANIHILTMIYSRTPFGHF